MDKLIMLLEHYKEFDTIKVLNNLDDNILSKWLKWLETEYDFFRKDHSQIELIQIIKSFIWFNSLPKFGNENQNLDNLKIRFEEFDNLNLIDKITVYGIITSSYLTKLKNENKLENNEIQNYILATRNIKDDYLINLENHSLFKNVGNLFLSQDGSRFDAELEDFIQILDSNLEIFKYIRFIDYYFYEFNTFMSKERIKELVQIIFDITDFKNFIYPEYINPSETEIILVYKKIFTNLKRIISVKINPNEE